MDTSTTTRNKLIRLGRLRLPKPNCVRKQRRSGDEDNFSDVFPVLDVVVGRSSLSEREARVNGWMDLALAMPSEDLEEPSSQQLRLAPHVSEVHTDERFVVVNESRRRKTEERCVEKCL